jgi:uncharacterized protein
MSGRLPVAIDPLRFAETGRRLEGRLLLGGFDRLAPLLSDTTGEIEVELEFGIDDMRVPFLSGHIQGHLRLTCQRCMEPMDYEVDSHFILGLVQSDYEADGLREDYEPLLVGDEPMVLADIIEDELILTLPIVPSHELSACPVTTHVTDSSTENTADEAVNPFAVLSELKKGKTDKPRS